MKRKNVLKSCAALLLCALCLCAFLVPAAAAKKQKIALADCRVTLSYKKTTYNGQAKTPDVTVTSGKKTLKANKHYVVRYQDNTEVGYATVTVKAKKGGGCTGSKTVQFSILPRKAKQPQLVKATETTLKFRWEAVHGATGYTVYQYDPLHDTYVKYKSTKKTYMTAKALTSGKTYLFVVRACANTGSGRLYGKYSPWLNAKTKAAAPQSTKAAAVQATIESGTYTLAFTADRGLLAGKQVTVWKKGENLAVETSLAGNRLRMIRRDDGLFVLMPARQRYAKPDAAVFNEALNETAMEDLLRDLAEKTTGTPQRTEVRKGKTLLQRELYRAEDGTALALDFDGDTLVRVVYYSADGDVNVTTIEAFSPTVPLDIFEIPPSYQKVDSVL